MENIYFFLKQYLIFAGCTNASYVSISPWLGLLRQPSVILGFPPRPTEHHRSPTQTHAPITFASTHNLQNVLLYIFDYNSLEA